SSSARRRCWWGDEMWPSNWHPIDDNPALVAGLTSELQRELSAGHPLFGLPVRAIAGHAARDDVLFTIEDGSSRVAVVHLTWTRNPPEQFPWPGTSIYANLSEWVEASRNADHRDFVPE
ncbi:MAG: hypothetical protein K2W96_24880, partial [Gemmataceae bacterium]|nr:hypothetical protein [Gemmataceae bacterium]